MTLVIGITSALVTIGVSVGLFLWARWRSKAEAAQFVEYWAAYGPSPDDRFGFSAAVPEHLNRGALIVHAAREAGQCCTDVWGLGIGMRALNGVRIIVHPVNFWTDPLTGREVGGTSRYGEIHVGADLSSLFHELAHRVIEVKHGVIDEEHAYFTEAVRAADERYRAAVKGVEP